jgi:hypothetical protein
MQPTPGVLLLLRAPRRERCEAPVVQAEARIFVRFCANHRIAFAGAVLETMTVEDFDEGRLGGLDRPNFEHAHL